MKKKNGIPDRWLDYYPVGKRVAGTRFVAFKVPLKEALCTRLRYQDRFTPRLLMEQLPELGLVVDLTNTNRYYSGQEFEQQGIKYHKLLCPGHDIPKKALVHRFYNIVDQYIRENPNPESLIGTHCTHGLNRTAFFLCSYMIERMAMAPQEALTAFQNARGYNVERENYIEKLMLLRPLSAPHVDKPKAPYPIQEKPHLVHKVGRKEYPTSNETMHVIKHQKYDADNVFQVPVLSQYSSSQRQHYSNHQSNMPPYRDRGWKNSYQRQTQTFSHYSNGFEQQQIFENQLYNSTDNGRGAIVNSYTTGPQGRILNGCSDGSQVAIRNTPDISGRWKASVNKYREFGIKACRFKDNVNIGTQGRNFRNNSEGNYRGRMMPERGRSMSMNITNNTNDRHVTYQSVPEGAKLQKTSRHNATHNDSLAQTCSNRQPSSMFRS